MRRIGQVNGFFAIRYLDIAKSFNVHVVNIRDFPYEY